MPYDSLVADLIGGHGGLKAERIFRESDWRTPRLS
nr:MAG TPA: hypothetical protein [Caudoviricetes sp.]